MYSSPLYAIDWIRAHSSSLIRVQSLKICDRYNDHTIIECLYQCKDYFHIDLNIESIQFRQEMIHELFSKFPNASVLESCACINL